MTYRRTPREAYNDQMKSAKKRGIGWQFTFESWEKWWYDELGPTWFAKRGHHTGQYVMARKGDVGPYSKDNVWCAKAEENHNEFNSHKNKFHKPYRKHLDAHTVAAIYQADGLYADVAKQFGLDVHSIHRIKCGKCYTKITNRLEKGQNN